MSDEQPTPSHEMIEEAFMAPKDVLTELPNVTETREARRLLDIAADLAHAAREKNPDR